MCPSIFEPLATQFLQRLYFFNSILGYNQNYRSVLIGHLVLVMEQCERVQTVQWWQREMYGSRSGGGEDEATP